MISQKNRKTVAIPHSDSLIITNMCPFCNKIGQVTVEIEDWKKYKDGALIQNAFPYLSADDRELIMTGICNDCFPK